MNTIKIGKDFERKAFDFLKSRFDNVLWLSEKFPSSFDFKVIKDRKEYFIDAKFISTKSKPKLLYTQRNADFIIINNKENFLLYNKEEIKENCNISNVPEANININKITRDKLIIMKVQKAFSNMDEVINYLLEKEGKTNDKNIL